ncbi:BamA/TamA family outer membrane protein [Foetidibacter luteolus]|uniref:BamA/TamA family outer membrane protein n=1 Tax=Foetidibacter luteolus TaxID=2608880 RepID=UPI00129A5C93|nr:BamA/TamA family outer membrane protein [Foetidibacter luteolus]
MLKHRGEQIPHYHSTTCFAKLLLFLFVTGVQLQVYGQQKPLSDTLRALQQDSIAAQKTKDSLLYSQYDIGDLISKIIHPRRKPDSLRKKSSITAMPNIASNPSIGFQVGIKAVAGRVLGKDPNTYMSVAATSASVTTKGIMYFYFTHNVFTPGNKWNIQGSLVAAKTVTPDFGLGIGNEVSGSEPDKILANAGRKGYVLNAQYYRLTEKVYKQIWGNLFAGAGVSFDIRRKIEDKHNQGELTPNNIYSDRNGFSRDHYASNGLLFSLEYTTRDNQNNAYKGIFADIGFRFNETWLGSTKSAVQFTTDFRKYWSLSEHSPGHVIAVWNWGAYLITGVLPYLEIPGTGKDMGGRSGRGYTITYFKGNKYNYSEVEYRFPITRNKFLSGVTFFNLQTANDLAGTKLFQVWQPGGGAGLRILFNKATRTNLCLDYAWGKYGSRGLFLNLNETF